MRHTSPAHHRSVAEFRDHLQRIDPNFDCVDAPEPAPDGPLARPLEIGGRRVGNRFATHPMEGWDAQPDGLPGPHTLRRWRRFGQSGAKLIWGGEAFAVQAEGRANPHQLHNNPAVDVASGLAALRAEVLAGHAEAGLDPADLSIGLQLTHSGRFSRPAGPFAPRIAVRHALLERKYPASAGVEPLTDLELEEIGARYVDAAKLAQAAGFDFVDVKCCHGYLLHELLGAKARPGRYGGDLAGRTLLFRRIVDGIRSACPGLEVGVRVSIADTLPFEADPESRVGRPMPDPDGRHGFGVDRVHEGGFALDESFEFLRLVEGLGIRLVNLSLGSPYYNPHLSRPAAYPPSDGYLPPDDPLVFVLQHLRVTRACKAACPGLALVGTGYTYLQEYLPHVAEHEVAAGHVDFVGLGRMLLSYPDLPADVLAGRPLQRRRICRTFSDCTTAPRNGMLSGCFPLDPYYKQMPEAARLKALKRELAGPAETHGAGPV
jgi:2,4-dienoyl-CoA reductase-like NADH-dependent reductase (Old Yellow Enzyme family)